MKNPQVSLFSGYNNPHPQSTIPITDFLLSADYMSQVEQIRKCRDSQKRRELKAQLPAITPSGIFTVRRDQGLIQHSGLICLDLDGKDNPHIEDWEAVKEQVSPMPGLYYAGLSVSGNGLFLVYLISNTSAHRQHYAAIVEDLGQYGLNPDARCANLSRLRGASYDPHPYFNPDVLASEKQCLVVKPAPKMPMVPIYPENLTENRVLRLVQLIDETGTDMTDYYPDWFALGCSLASEFGESGRGFFHVISRQSHKYRPERCDKEYNNCLHSCSRSRISTFFWYCKKFGVTLKSDAQ